ncbi:MAG: hypothetical protein IJ357_04845 [Oscillospiraceae bacterium]|nr:hypothetical protein [Oscillospiraceae bacterium]
MKRSTLRILCACLLMALPLAASMGVIGATRAPTAPPAATAAPTAATEPTEGALWVRMVIVSPLPELRLCRPDGVLLQTLHTNGRGQAATDLLEPGEYLAVSADSRVRFRLNENASITVLEGNGWSDGELLYLSGEDTGTLTLLRSISPAEAAEGPGWMDYTLRRSGTERHQVLRFETAGTETLIFRGLACGSYDLLENGVTRARIVITKSAPDVTLELTESEALLHETRTPTE